MKQTTSKAVFTAIISTSALQCGAQIQAHPDDTDGTHALQELAETTVVARRADQAPDATTSSLYTLDSEDLKAIGVKDLTAALDLSPATLTSGGGQSGTVKAVRFRGLRGEDTQFRIDGIRFSGSQGSLAIFAGNTSLTGISKIELLQGPQSTLYGGGSAGGVVNLTTQRGYADMGSTTSVEAGSFNSLSIGHSDGGTLNDLSYYFASNFSTTDNDTYGDNSEANGFDNDSVRYESVIRLDYNLRSDLSIGFTTRSNDSNTETPQGNIVDSEFTLSTLFVDYQVNDKLKSKLTFNYLLENTEFGGSFPFDVDYDQFGISSENSFQYSGKGQLNFGAEYENQDYTNSASFNPVNRKDHYLAVYANHAYELRNLTFDAGVRYEDYQSFGSHTSWNTGILYHLNDKKTQLRANLGTGFNTPTLIELFSPGGTAGNPDLDPETSLGWDVGITHAITANHHASVTYFDTEIEDAITFTSDYSTYTNVAGKSNASGITASFDGDITSKINYALNYTWLDRSIAGQPEQQVNAQITFQPTEKAQFGIGVQYLDNRSFGGNPLEDAFIVRVFGSYKITDSIKLHARVENLTDTEYSHVDFTSAFGPDDSPASRLGVFAGVTIDW